MLFLVDIYKRKKKTLEETLTPPCYCFCLQTRFKKEKQKGVYNVLTYRSALRTLIPIVSAIFIPVHTDAKAAEIMAAFQNNGVLEEVQTNSTCQFLPQVISRCTSSRHVYKPTSSGELPLQEVKEEDRGREVGTFVECRFRSQPISFHSLSIQLYFNYIPFIGTAVRWTIVFNLRNHKLHFYFTASQRSI